MDPQDAALMLATQLRMLGVEAEFLSASPRSIRFVVPRLSQLEISMGDDMWAALPGLPVAVGGIPVRYEERGQ
jgi:hypothetical protein